MIIHIIDPYQTAFIPSQIYVVCEYKSMNLTKPRTYVKLLKRIIALEEHLHLSLEAGDGSIPITKLLPQDSHPCA